MKKLNQEIINFKTPQAIITKQCRQRQLNTKSSLKFLRKPIYASKQIKQNPTLLNPQIQIKFFSPRYSTNTTNKNIDSARSSQNIQKIKRKPSGGIKYGIRNHIKQFHIQNQQINYQKQIESFHSRKPNKQQLEEQNFKLKKKVIQFQQKLAKFNSKKLDNQLFNSKITNFSQQTSQSNIIYKLQKQIKIKDDLIKKMNIKNITEQLINKINQLEMENNDLMQKYKKKCQEAKYQQIQLGTLRKKKNQIVALQIKILRLTQKNRTLQQKIQMLKKQAIKVNNIQKNKIRRNSSDSIFSLSPDQSQDSSEIRNTYFHK